MIALTACSNAKSSSEINAAYVPSGKYERMTCKDLRAEERSANNTLSERTSEIEKAAEVVGWLLFAPALLLMDGNSDEQKRLGQAKGTVLAIQDAMDKKGC